MWVWDVVFIKVGREVTSRLSSCNGKSVALKSSLLSRDTDLISS